ncbi:hypothetical protein [Desertibaculum subflavum]|uniref:hypothetical protein n=1 Tax=Desertibaculum subflavum TaxID=2268458 RepID=UPI000E66C510
MNLFIGLLPFILLPALRAFLSPRLASLASFGLAGITLLRQALAGGPKSLNILVFALLGLAALAVWRRPALAERWNGVVVDGTLALYAFVGLAVGLPFSAEFARDTVEPTLWTHPVFLHVTAAITLAWGVGFLLLTALAWPASWLRARRWQRIVATVLVMLAAAGFTAWYPDHARAAFIAGQGGGSANR